MTIKIHKFKNKTSSYYYHMRSMEKSSENSHVDIAAFNGRGGSYQGGVGF